MLHAFQLSIPVASGHYLDHCRPILLACAAQSLCTLAAMYNDSSKPFRPSRKKIDDEQKVELDKLLELKQKQLARGEEIKQIEAEVFDEVPSDA